MNRTLILALGLIALLAIPAELYGQRRGGGGRGGGGGGRGGGRGGPPGRGAEAGPDAGPERVARTEMRWNEGELVVPPPPGGEGQESVEAEQNPVLHLMNKFEPKGAPALIYFSRDGRGTEREELETALFEDEKISLAANYFRMIRVEVGDIKDEALAKRYTDSSGPVILVLEPDGKGATPLKGWKTTNTRLLKAMGGPFAKVFKLDLGGHINKEQRFLDQIDQIYTEIAQKKEELVSVLTSDSESARRKEVAISERLAELEKRLEAAKREEKEHMEGPLSRLKETAPPPPAPK